MFISMDMGYLVLPIQAPIIRDGSRIAGKGVRMYKVVGVRFADFISFFLNIPMQMK